MDPFELAKRRQAIASIESGGNYNARGQVIPSSGDRAYGKYQVMGANVGPWTQLVLGHAMTPDQFLSDPQAQDRVFDYMFEGYAQKYGLEGAAQAWLGGPGSVGKTKAADPLGTTVGAYGKKFMQTYNAADKGPNQYAVGPDIASLESPKPQQAYTAAKAAPAGGGGLPAAATTPASQPAQPPSMWSTIADAGSAFGQGMTSNPYTAPPIPPTPGAARIDEAAVPTVDPQQQAINQQRMQMALQLLNAGRLT